jgi:hypothetical protein
MLTDNQSECQAAHSLRPGCRRVAAVCGMVLVLMVWLPALIGQNAPGAGGPPHEDVAKAGIAGETLQATKPQAAPNAAPRPFLRLIAVLFSGLVISTARLARKFRRFWGLGVFANPYSALFLTFSVGISGIPVTTESYLSSLPGLQSTGAWIADLAGIVVAFVPFIRFKPQGSKNGSDKVRDLEGASTSNPILAVIEDAIRDRILARMQSEIVAATRLYDWETIKVAASRALEEEMTIRPLADEDYNTERKLIENYQSGIDPRLDSRNKYEALLHVLRWCSFKRLRHGLDAAAKESAA